MERNELKPCPYCHEDGEGYYTANGAFWVGYSFIDGWQLHGGKCKPRTVNYCFMCGRKLKNERT